MSNHAETRTSYSFSSVRVKQVEKRHFADPSLACALLKATPEKLLADLETLGFLFEALCERDVKIYAESFGANLYHYQDYRNREIDAVIELPDGTWCAFEIKLGAYQIDAAADTLLRIKREIEDENIWLTQKMLSTLYNVEIPTINYQIKKNFSDLK